MLRVFVLDSLGYLSRSGNLFFTDSVILLLLGACFETLPWKAETEILQSLYTNKKQD